MLRKGYLDFSSLGDRVRFMMPMLTLSIIINLKKLRDV